MLETLQLGQTILTSVRIAYADAKAKTGRKIYAEFRERKKNPTLLGILNAGDARFSAGNTVPAWIIAEPEQFYRLFNIPTEVQQKLATMPVSTGMKTVDMQEGVHKLTLNVLNPTINGQRVRVQINESTTAPDAVAKPKMNPSTGEILMFNGLPIYRKPSVVLGEPKDVTIEHNGKSVPGAAAGEAVFTMAAVSPATV